MPARNALPRISSVWAWTAPLEGARLHARNPELVSRAHFARYMVERGLVRDTNAAFKRYLTPGKPGYVAHQWATLGESVEWITAAGGVAVIAPPRPLQAEQSRSRIIAGRISRSGWRRGRGGHRQSHPRSIRNVGALRATFRVEGFSRHGFSWAGRRPPGFWQAAASAVWGDAGVDRIRILNPGSRVPIFRHSPG